MTFHTATEQMALIPLLAAVEAELHPRLALETRLCSTSADQSGFEAAGQTLGRLLLNQSAVSDDAVLAEPEQHQVMRSAAAGQCIAPEAHKDQQHAEIEPTPESAQQHPTASGPAEAHQPSSRTTLAPACNSVNAGPANSTCELPQQAQQEAQQDQQDTHCPVDTVTSVDAACHDAKQGQQEYMAGAVQRQDSSSMVSLSPSLKLDIPGLDDILSSDLLTENDAQATSQLQPNLQQVSQHNQRDGSCHHHDQQQHQQQSVDQQQQQQQQSVDEQKPKADQQQEIAQRSAYPAGPESSQGTPDDHDALQSTLSAPAHQEPLSLGAHAKIQAGASASSAQGVLCQQAKVQTASKPGHPRSDITAHEDSIADIALAARQHLLAAESQGPSEAVIQSPAGPLAPYAGEDGSAAEQADPLPNLAEQPAGGPALPAAVGAASDADGSAKSAAAACSHSTASQPTLEDGVQASASSSPSSQHVPSADDGSMSVQADSHEPGQSPTSETVAKKQVLAATDLHTELAADCPATAAEQKAATGKQPQSLQQNSMTGSQQVRPLVNEATDAQYTFHFTISSPVTLALY